MPRKKFQPNSELPYHVSARCLNKEWFAMPIEDAWELFSDYLFFIHHAYGVKIHSFVLMNNHFHMLIRTPNANLPAAMNYLMRETSKRISTHSGRINQTYGGPYHWTILKDPIYFFHCYKYVYRNPVEAGLARTVESYPFSTLSALLGQSHTIIPLESDDLLFDGVETQLEWLNRAYPNQEIKLDIQNAIRKKEFKFALDKKSKPNFLESILV